MAFMRVIFILSWGMRHEKLPFDFACDRMDSRQYLLSELTRRC
jgi:hypothetical protein